MHLISDAVNAQAPIFFYQESRKRYYSSKYSKTHYKTHHLMLINVVIQVAELRWQATSAPFIYVSWLFLACIAKLSELAEIKAQWSVTVFQRATALTKIFPESSLLIAVGLALGALLQASEWFRKESWSFFQQTQVSKAHFTLDSHLFFLYLLPPIIFDAGMIHTYFKQSQIHQ